MRPPFTPPPLTHCRLSKPEKIVAVSQNVCFTNRREKEREKWWGAWVDISNLSLTCSAVKKTKLNAMDTIKGKSTKAQTLPCLSLLTVVFLRSVVVGCCVVVTWSWPWSWSSFSHSEHSASVHLYPCLQSHTVFCSREQAAFCTWSTVRYKLENPSAWEKCFHTHSCTVKWEHTFTHTHSHMYTRVLGGRVECLRACLFICTCVRESER